ncbi:hypothetical protein ACIRYZ_28795 [Kitasatospora sp. NPDC101155]|uniref:hypothetical protein n=1 Tax=Kitasatospora sp. NPDC101155 TaxID=3364097 RepID=UPI00382AD589
MDRKFPAAVRKNRSARPKRWYRRHFLWTVIQIIIYLAGFLVFAWSVYFFLFVEALGWKLPEFLKSAETSCAENGLTCALTSGFAAPLLSLALTSAIFVLIRIRRVTQHIMKLARKRPSDLVETAGKIDRVVGRRDLCQVIINNMRERRIRRPHLLVGGVGAGKTAVLVDLTKRLAKHGAVPVPIRLRDVQDPNRLVFRELAYKRFLSEVEPRLLSTNEGERVWRNLCRDSKIVVLADGLEECLSRDAASNRDTVIRLAIHKADEMALPLIITSRPHESLQSASAVIMELEPLSQQAALSYVSRPGTRGEDQHRLGWIVATAEVAEAPIYLKITHELHENGLDRTAAAWSENALDTRCADRSRLRWLLLDTWMQAVLEGHLHGDVSLERTQREQAVALLSALACVGLKMDTLDVRFTDLVGKPGSPDRPCVKLRNRLETELGHPPSRPELLWAASFGERLDLVEVHQSGVRFQHSVMQAYLGSRLLETALADPGYLNDALCDPADRVDPGKEFLIALVLCSRAAPDPDGQARKRANTELTRRLLRRAATPDGTKAIKLINAFAAAFEIDSASDQPRIHDIADQLKKRWNDLKEAADPRSLEEAKLQLVVRFGEAARAISERGTRDDSTDLNEAVQRAYRALFKIGVTERCYAVRFAMAQQLGAGGADAFHALQDDLVRAWTSRAEEVESRGPEEWSSLVTCAWITPLLVGSMPEYPAPGQGDGLSQLKRWLRGWGDSPQEQACRSISFEMALAQGFKYAANRGPRHPRAPKWARDVLSETAAGMLKGARFWFSQLTLVQALVLYTLSETGGRPPRRGHGSHPKQTVRHWLELAATGAAVERPEHLHPFVCQTGRLAVRALIKAEPERFLWIDEAGVVAHVGSRATAPAEDRKLWIPPSTGWVVLDHRAQRLVADVFVLLNLAERGGGMSDREGHLAQTATVGVPPCLTESRDPLRLDLTVGTGTAPVAGSTCKDGCPFELCPYPPRGGDSVRAELSEAFCHRQQLLTLGVLRAWPKRHLRPSGGRWLPGRAPRSARNRSRAVTVDDCCDTASDQHHDPITKLSAPARPPGDGRLGAPEATAEARVHLERAWRGTAAPAQTPGTTSRSSALAFP